MIAVKRLQSLFWVLLVALGALGAYLVSLRVATERNEVMRVQAQIARARDDIRYLETEFAARSSIRQLEKWNSGDFRYSTRTAEQYLDGERSLANLDGVEANGPAFVAPPVMVAMIDDGQREEAQPVVTPSPATLQIRSDVSTIRTASAADVRSEPARAELVSRVDKAEVNRSTTKKSSTDKTLDKPKMGRAEPADTRQSALARKAERMAMLDARLLDDRTLGDIGRKAAVEKRGRNN